MAEATEHSAGNHSNTLSHKISAKADKIKYLVLAAVVVTAVGVALFSYQRRSIAAKEAEAENRIFQAVIDLQAAPESDALALFGQAAREYAGMPAGERALILKFSYAFNTRDFKAAEEAARDLLRVYPESAMTNRAKLALGQTLGMQGRDPEAIALFRELNAVGDVAVLAESKLALAQALEREAEKVKDDPEQYRQALEAAEAEYNDIIVRSRITIPSQRGFWPQAVTMPADFALVMIKDKLAGYSHSEPRAADAPVTRSELDGVMAIRPPADPAAEGENEAADDAPAEEETEEKAEDAAGEAAEKAE